MNSQLDLIVTLLMPADNLSSLSIVILIGFAEQTVNLLSQKEDMHESSSI